MPHGGLPQDSLPHSWPSSFSLLLQQNGGKALCGALGALGVLHERRTVTEHTAPKAKSRAVRQAAPSFSPLGSYFSFWRGGGTLVKPFHQTTAKTGLSTQEHSLLL